MQTGILVEPQQGASYEELRTIAQTAERGGFDVIVRSDHYLAIGAGGRPPGPSDAWITLAGLARDTTSIRLGTLVSPVTFRRPSQLAIAVANVDEMSDGRVELGIGAGWYADEHRACGIPFPEPSRKRFDMLEEQLEILTGLWATPTTERYEYSGDHYTIAAMPALPKPVQPFVPIIIGGRGTSRTPELAARFATEWNAPFCSIEVFADRRDAVRRACDDIGRDPNSIRYSAVLTACFGTTEKELHDRSNAIGRSPETLRDQGLYGTPEEVAGTIAAWHRAGVERLYFQMLDIADLDHLMLISQEVLPAVAEVR